MHYRFIRAPRGVSKMTPIMICFGLLAMLGIWIVYDISTHNYEQNVIRKEGDPPRATVQVVTPPVAGHPPVTPQPTIPQQPHVIPAQPLVPVNVPAPTFTCRYTNKPIQIDGDVSGPEWADAEIVAHFMHLKDASPARSRTEARVLWDDQYLYFCAQLDDADVYSNRERHNDMIWYDDVFELFFKPDPTKLAYYEFQVNAKGTTMEMFLPSRGSGGYGRWIGKHQFHVEAKAVLRPNSTLNNPADKDAGWVVEGRIPWSDFAPTGGAPKPDAEWKFALCRYDYSVEYDKEDLSSCAPLKDGFHNYENYASLKFSK